jgi:hypothetical protein
VPLCICDSITPIEQIALLILQHPQGRTGRLARRG